MTRDMHRRKVWVLAAVALGVAVAAFRMHIAAAQGYFGSGGSPHER